MVTLFPTSASPRRLPEDSGRQAWTVGSHVRSPQEFPPASLQCASHRDGVYRLFQPVLDSPQRQTGGDIAVTVSNKSLAVPPPLHQMKSVWWSSQTCDIASWGKKKALTGECERKSWFPGGVQGTNRGRYDIGSAAQLSRPYRHASPDLHLKV